MAFENDKIRVPGSCEQTPRKTRRSYNIPGQGRALTFSCHRRMPLLAAERSRGWLIDSLVRARTRMGFELSAYVIMPEHVHLFLRPLSQSAEIAPILKAIKQGVARKATNYLRSNHPGWLPRLAVRRPTGRVEHRFWQQGGGYDRNIITDKAARAVIDYIHRNPVNRGLVERPTDWAWSSARWFSGAGDALLEMDVFPWA